MVLLVSHISGCRQTWCIHSKAVTGSDILKVLKEREGSNSEVVLQCSGHILTLESLLPNDATVVATLRLPGGKGGFGSMLRAIGAQIEKTTNREACRDLSGRRLRDINEEKRLKDFISKKAEREKEVQDRKRQKFEKLNEKPKHVFQDESYFQQREIREKNLFESLDKAFSKDKNGGTSGVKRCSEAEAKPVAKIKKARFMDDLDESSDEASESEEESVDNSEMKGSSSGEDNICRNESNKKSDTNGVKHTSSSTSDCDETSSVAEGSESSTSSKEPQPESKAGDSR